MVALNYKSRLVVP